MKLTDKRMCGCHSDNPFRCAEVGDRLAYTLGPTPEKIDIPEPLPRRCECACHDIDECLIRRNQP
jgi:hypothetical protein